MDPKQGELAKVKQDIDTERKSRSSIIGALRSCRGRLAYKAAEKAAISKLSEMSIKSTKDIGYLRRKKEQLEFRIATEAFTLEAERELIRKKNEIEQQLNESLKSFRLRKKVEYIDRTIAELDKRVAELGEKLKESDKRLDILYPRFRKLTGEASQRQRQRFERKQQKEMKSASISLADIAVINGKESAKDEDNTVFN